MTENEFLLEDRLQKIRQIIGKYGEDKFIVSFSGGKDSTVLSALVDMALPENKIPRVYANTGIDYRLIVEFVERERERASVGTCYYKANNTY
jgi:3'-phosphoadenosine 5'-phosphosulfate sulfotransferase (PAPS reductase)/FAD synthetase